MSRVFPSCLISWRRNENVLELIRSSDWKVSPNSITYFHDEKRECFTQRGASLPCELCTRSRAEAFCAAIRRWSRTWLGKRRRVAALQQQQQHGCSSLICSGVSATCTNTAAFCSVVVYGIDWTGTECTASAAGKPACDVTTIGGLPRNRNRRSDLLIRLLIV